MMCLLIIGFEVRLNSLSVIFQFDASSLRLLEDSDDSNQTSAWSLTRNFNSNSASKERCSSRDWTSCWISCLCCSFCSSNRFNSSCAIWTEHSKDLLRLIASARSSIAFSNLFCKKRITVNARRVSDCSLLLILLQIDCVCASVELSLAWEHLR